MSLVQHLHFLPLPRPARAPLRAPRWLERLYTAYAQAGMLGVHR